jgi:hypothetical protein
MTAHPVAECCGFFKIPACRLLQDDRARLEIGFRKTVAWCMKPAIDSRTVFNLERIPPFAYLCDGNE